MNILPDLLLTALCLVAVTYIYKRFSLFSKGTYIAILVFLLLSVFAGRVLGIYSLIPYWDKVLHFLSGFLLVAIAKGIYDKLGGDRKNERLFFAFSLFFALAGAALWEIYEFAADSLLATTSQNASLTDTMWDMIAGSFSALIGTFIQHKKHTS